MPFLERENDFVKRRHPLLSFYLSSKLKPAYLNKNKLIIQAFFAYHGGDSAINVICTMFKIYKYYAWNILDSDI